MPLPGSMSMIVVRVNTPEVTIVAGGISVYVKRLVVVECGMVSRSGLVELV